MDPQNLNAADWLGMDLPAARHIAQNIGRALDVQLREVFLHEYAGRRAPVAVFEIDGRAFSLVPGGSMQLGFDEQRWIPTEDEMTSFLGDPDALDLVVRSGTGPEAPPTWSDDDLSEIRSYLAEHTTRPRTTTVASLLVAINAYEAGVSEVPLNHPLIQVIISEQPYRVEGTHLVDYFTPDDDTTTYGRVRYGKTGRPEKAWLAVHVTYDEITTELSTGGQRLLHPDEWEHAVAPGTTTLFPWGDRCPDRRVDGWQAKDWRATDKIGTPDGRWLNEHEPKLAGLHIAENPYHLELTADPVEVRGGDGGGASHGGDPWFYNWLPHAASYRDPDQSVDNRQRLGVRRMWVRPALPII